MAAKMTPAWGFAEFVCCAAIFVGVPLAMLMS
jgi:hypothetical protein